MDGEPLLFYFIQSDLPISIYIGKEFLMQARLSAARDYPQELAP
jgi:hypothetical protein